MRIDSAPTHHPDKAGASSGWLARASNLKTKLQDDNVVIVSAGIAFFFFLALIPALGAVVAIYSVIADPSQVLELSQRLSDTLPGGGQNLIISQLRDAVTSSSTSTVGWGTALGLVLALWSASTGTTSLITALNIAYDKDARSGFAEKRWVGILLTLALVAIATGGVYVGTEVLGLIDGAGFPSWLHLLAVIGFWLAVAALLIAILSGIYRFAPNRETPEWGGILWGASIAVALAVVATIGLRTYASNFSALSEAYGSMATIIVAMFYFLILAFAMVLGAEIDSGLQTRALRTDK